MLQFTVPSKTFLLGEYVALQGGPTLVLSSQPRFCLNVKKLDKTTPVIFEGLVTESPAGKLVTHYEDLFKGKQLIFSDPHHGLGGFGASSAQFLLVAVLKRILQNKDSFFNFDYPLQLLLEEYRKFSWDGIGFAPSGADVVAQMQGGISYFCKTQNKAASYSWPFDNINYYLLRTGNKLATHLHLRALPELDLDKLTNTVLAGLQCLQANDLVGFIQAISAYAQIMQQQNLLAEQTLALLQQINTCKHVLAAKGCGALGADVILVLVEKTNHKLFLAWLKQIKLKLANYDNQAAQGFKLETNINLII